MAVRKIVQYGNPILRRKTEKIDRVDDDLRDLAEDMVDTMFEAEGIGLAAPQVGESISMCVVNMGLIEEGAEPKAFVNPEIYETEGLERLEEGCLSIPDIREDIDRPTTIQLRYTDIKGIEHDERAEGMLARVLQHEIDHLDGVLFIDRLSPMRRKLLAKKLKRIAANGDS